MRKRRRLSKIASRALRSKKSFKTIICSVRGCTNKMDVDNEAVSGVCWECVQKKVGIDPKYLTQPKKGVKKVTGFPRGWHLYKQFVHSDGRVFEYGKENEKLKGSIPVTKVKVNTLSKSERRRLRDEKKARREKRLAKQYKKKMKEKNE